MATPRRTLILRALVAGAFLLLSSTPSVAFAEAFAVVTSIKAQDAGGRWRKVDSSPDAVWVDGDTERPLAVDMELPEGALIRTGLARVKVELPPTNQIEIHEGAELALHDWGVLQVLGDAYYKVRGAFTVDYGTVEATVEGTVFDVHGPDPKWVAVRKGRVRVTTENGDEVLVRAGERVVVGEDGKLSENETWKRCADCGEYHER